MHQDNNHRIIVGDINRSRVRQYSKDDSISEQTYQADMWRLGALIYFIITGEQYDTDTSVPNFHSTVQPWYSLSTLLQRDYILRLSASALMHHPTFWYFLPNRVGSFYKQLVTGNPINISGLLSKLDTSALYPRKNWISVIYPDNNLQQGRSFSQNGTSILRLIQLIVHVVTRNQSDEYYNAVISQATNQCVDPIMFFQKNFPCLLFQIWELFFQEKKYLENQKIGISG